jgi:hypothetical protein
MLSVYKTLIDTLQPDGNHGNSHPNKLSLPDRKKNGPQAIGPGCAITWHRDHEPPRVHHAARRRGRFVAAGGARTAARADAADRRVDERGRPEGQARLAAFLKGLEQLGWTVGKCDHGQEALL